MSYIAGTDLTFEIALVDAAGNAVDATSVEFAVYDGEGAELLPFATLTGYTAGSDATVTVPATYNTLAPAVLKAAREIVLKCVTPNGVALVSKTYVVEQASGSLVRGVNSLVTLASADMLAAEMTSAQAWTTAVKQQKINALLEAYRRLGRLRLIPLDNFYYDRQRPFVSRAATSILDLSISEVLSLDAKLIAALSLAQVAEADVILTGDPAEARRRDGLILDTIGDVKQMYRGTKPLELPISRRALEYVSNYVTLGSKMVGRA